MQIILFDGVCILCNAAVRFLIKHDPDHHFYFAAQQTNAGKQLIKNYGISDSLTSIIFIKDNMVLDKSDAIIEIAKSLKGWPSILRYGRFVPKLIRDFMYDIIANNRYRLFGKRETCAIPTKAQMDHFIL